MVGDPDALTTEASEAPFLSLLLSTVKSPETSEVLLKRDDILQKLALIQPPESDAEACQLWSQIKDEMTRMVDLATGDTVNVTLKGDGTFVKEVTSAFLEGQPEDPAEFTCKKMFTHLKKRVDEGYYISPFKDESNVRGRDGVCVKVCLHCVCVCTCVCIYLCVCVCTVCVRMFVWMYRHMYFSCAERIAEIVGILLVEAESPSGGSELVPENFRWRRSEVVLHGLGFVALGRLRFVPDFDRLECPR